MLPGEVQKGKRFELLLDSKFFSKGNTLFVDTSGTKVQVKNGPTTHYNTWYYKFLNWITFRKYFNIKHTYTVEII